MRNIFPEKSYTNMVGKLVPDHFIKNQNSAYLSINSVKCHIVFFDMPKWRGLQKYIKIKVLTICSDLIYSFLKKHVVWN